MVLSRLVRDLPADLLVKYRDAFAGATTRLSLTLLSDLALTPVVKPKPVIRGAGSWSATEDGTGPRRVAAPRGPVI